MNSLLAYFKESTRGALLGFILVLLFCLEIFTGGFLGLYKDMMPAEPELYLKISEIEGPTIDGGAATISLEEERCLTGNSFPGGLWFLALLAISALLIGNFALALRSKHNIEWLPELLYVTFALIIWWALDACHVTLWFPLVLIKVSLLIFALYLYLFEMQKNILQE